VSRATSSTLLLCLFIFGVWTGKRIEHRHGQAHVLVWDAEQDAYRHFEGCGRCQR